MDIFRTMLIDLIPTMERAKIAWNEDDDSFDSIAENLFDTVVLESIKNCEPLIYENEVSIPSYDISYENYSNLSLIEFCFNESSLICYNVFKCFRSYNMPFDTVEYIEIDKKKYNSNLIVNCIIEKIIPISEINDYKLIYKDQNKDIKIIKDLSVYL